MTTTSDERAATALKGRLRGTLIRPGDAEYDMARAVWNGMIDRSPAMIVRPAVPEDVIAAVNFARESGLPLAVRGGGHNAAGLSVCDGGIVIDLSAMTAVAVDPDARTARAQGGATWGDFDAATAAHGLATTGGLISSTGVAGLTLGGGLGWLMREYGLACDNLLSVEVVTADGRLVTASESENADLFWGLRGGGGNFGVATSFVFRLHPVSEVLAGMIVHPVERAGEVLRLYREVMAAAPDGLTVFAPLMTTPEGAKVIALIVCYSGPIAEGEAAIKRLREFAPALADSVQPMAYADLQRMLDEAFPHGLQVYWRSHFLTGLPDTAIDAMLDRFAGVTSPLTAVIVEPMGGAVGRVSDDATAFDQRDAAYNLAIIARWTEPAEADRHIAWARDLWEAMRPYADGVYVNYLGVGDGAERVRDAYGPAKYERLAALKATYDSGNLFRLNQNIVPSG
ncbi:MAG: FAD-binding oxidoreductase [Dehalococcoidia bacterium]